MVSSAAMAALMAAYWFRQRVAKVPGCLDIYQEQASTRFDSDNRRQPYSCARRCLMIHHEARYQFSIKRPVLVTSVKCLVGVLRVHSAYGYWDAKALVSATCT